MEIRSWSCWHDLVGALDVRDRALKVGYRGVVDESAIDAAVLEPDESDVSAFADDLDGAGEFLVAVAEDPDAEDPTAFDVEGWAPGAAEPGERMLDAPGAVAGGAGGEEATDEEHETAEASGDETAEASGDETAEASGDETAGADEQRVLGFSRVRWGSTSSHVGPMEGEIVELYVDPAYWRQGVGSALLDQTAHWVPGLLEGLVVTVLETNDRGRGFLEAEGFEPAETVTRTLGDAEFDAVVYRRPT